MTLSQHSIGSDRPNLQGALALAYRIARGQRLRGLDTVVTHLDAIVRQVRRLLGDFEVTLAQPPETWLGGIEGASPEAGPGTDPFFGYKTREPVWAAASEQRADSPAFLRLQSIYIAAYALDPDQLTREPALSTTRAAGLFIRRLATDPDLLKIVSPAISEEPDSLHTARYTLESYINGQSDLDDRVAQRVQALIRHIDYALGSRFAKWRGPRSEKNPYRPRIGDLDDDRSAISAEIPQPVDDVAAENRLSAGAAHFGEGNTRRYVAVAPDVKPAPRQDITQEILRARNKARAMRTEGQRLPFASNRLQLPDLEVFLDWASQTVHPTDNSGEPDASLILRNGAVLSLLAGKELDDVVTTRVAPDLTAIPKFTDQNDARILLVLDPPCLVLHSPKVEKAFSPDEHEQAFYRQVVPYILLPLPRSFPGVATLIRVAHERVSRKLFKADVDLLSRGMEKEFRRLNGVSGARLSPTRIAGFIGRFMADLGSDKAEAAFFTHNQLSQASAARLYYYAPLLQTLVDRFVSTWDHLPRAVSLGIKDLAWSWRGLPNPFAEYRTGSRGVARKELARRMFDEIRAKTMSLVPDPRSRVKTLEFHNHYTAYTALLVLWTTGIRAIRDPVEIELLDLTNGFLVISDKDEDEYANARVVCLDIVGCKQLEYYAKHRKAFLGRPTILDPKKNKKKGLPRKLEPENWLFFVIDGKPQAVTPSIIVSYFKDQYPFRTNSQRHFIRTELRDRGVDGIDVDALLGHAGYGEEAYGSYSCYSPARLKRKIAHAQTALASDLGLKAVRGLLPAKTAA